MTLLPSFQSRLEREREAHQSQRNLDLRVQAEQREITELRSQAERLRVAKETAEVKAAELEGTIRQQEKLVATLRQEMRHLNALGNAARKILLISV